MGLDCGKDGVTCMCVFSGLSLGRRCDLLLYQTTGACLLVYAGVVVVHVCVCVCFPPPTLLDTRAIDETGGFETVCNTEYMRFSFDQIKGIFLSETGCALLQV